MWIQHLSQHTLTHPTTWAELTHMRRITYLPPYIERVASSTSCTAAIPSTLLVLPSSTGETCLAPPIHEDCGIKLARNPRAVELWSVIIARVPPLEPLFGGSLNQQVSMEKPLFLLVFSPSSIHTDTASLEDGVLSAICSRCIRSFEQHTIDDFALRDQGVLPLS